MTNIPSMRHKNESARERELFSFLMYISIIEAFVVGAWKSTIFLILPFLSHWYDDLTDKIITLAKCS